MSTTPTTVDTVSDLRQLSIGQRVRDRDGDIWVLNGDLLWWLQRDIPWVKTGHTPAQLLKLWAPLLWLQSTPDPPAPAPEPYTLRLLQVAEELYRKDLVARGYKDDRLGAALMGFRAGWEARA